MRTGRVCKDLVHAKLLDKERCKRVFPVVKISCNEDWRAFGHHTVNAFSHHFYLPLAAPCKQAKVHDKAMHLSTSHTNHAMQQTTLLETVIRNVLVFVGDDRMTREQGIAMVGFIANGVTTIGALHVQRRSERLVLGVQAQMFIIAALHFLQKHHIGP